MAQVGLAESPEQRLVGLVVAGHRQDRILLDQSVQGVGQLVLVVVAPGRDGHGQHRPRKPDGRSAGPSGGRERVAGEGAPELGHRTDVAGQQRIDVHRLPALEAHHVAETLVVTRPSVGQVEVPADLAGQHPEVGHVAQVRVDGRLEDLDEGVGRRIGCHVQRGGTHGDGHRRAVHGRRPHLDDVVAQAVHGDGDGRRTADHREHRATDHATTEHLLELLERGHDTVQEPLQQGIVGHHDVLDQGVVDLVFAVLHLLGDLPQLGVSAVVDPGRVGQQVGDAVKPAGHADRDLERGHSGPEGRLQLGQHRLEVGVLPVQLVHEHQTGKAPLGGLTPQVNRGVVQAAGGVNHEDRQVGGGHGSDRLTGEVEGARGVEQVDLVAMPLQDGQRSGQRVADLLLLGLVVAHRRPVLHPAHPGN